MIILKRIFVVCITTALCASLFAQQKDFEGTIVYKNNVVSKLEGMSDKSWGIVLLLGDSITALVKQGNYKRTSANLTEYQVSHNPKTYLKFKGIDTLFYLDHSSDTGSVVDVSKPDARKTIAGYECKSITIKTSLTSKKFFYAPSLHLNPEYHRNNKIGQLDVYTKETESVWLERIEETDYYTLSSIATKVTVESIPNDVFDLPKLPEKKYTWEAIGTWPAFGRSGGWLRYLQTNLNTGLALKYLKMSKKDTVATQVAQVVFVVSEKGEVSNIKVLNKKDVHPKLAEEAVRVIAESGRWKPATLFGEKVSYCLQQPIVFKVLKE